MKIALVTYEYPPETAFGGIATYAGQAARVLADRHHHVEVFAASGREIGRHDIGGIIVNLVPELNRRLFATAVCPIFTTRHKEVSFDVVESPEYHADGREIQKAHPDLPHVVKLHTPTELLERISSCPPEWGSWVSHQVSQLRIMLGALRRFQCPTSYSPFPNHQLRKPDLHRVERDFVRKCDLVVSPSLALAEWASREWKLEPTKVMTVPYPYVPRSELLRVGIRESGKVVGYFGRLEQRKGILDLIDAIPTILKAEPESKFRLVGAPAVHAGTLERFDIYLMRRLKKFRHAIEVTGSCPLNEMPNEYQAIDIAVIPSIWENFPNVCLESMAAGRAIVASSAGGMAEMVVHEKSGILIPPRNSRDLAHAVIRLIRAPALRKSLGTAARQRVLDAYNGQVTGGLLEDSYARAIGHRHNLPAGV